MVFPMQSCVVSHLGGCSTSEDGKKPFAFGGFANPRISAGKTKWQEMRKILKIQGVVKKK